MKKIFYSFLTLGLLTAPIFVGAQPANPGATPEGPATLAIGDVQGFINKAASWMQYILFAVAVVFIILAAFNYLTAAGDAEKAGKAKKQITGAVIAIVVALLATGIVALTRSFIL